MFSVVTDKWPIKKPCEAIGVAARAPHLRIVKTDIGVRAKKLERDFNRGARNGFADARTFARCCEYTTVCSIRPDRANDVKIEDSAKSAHGVRAAKRLCSRMAEDWRLKIDARFSRIGGE